MITKISQAKKFLNKIGNIITNKNVWINPGYLSYVPEYKNKTDWTNGDIIDFAQKLDKTWKNY